MVESETRFNFTQKLLDALPPHPEDAKGMQRYYSDAGCTGLNLAVSKTGRKFWNFRYQWRGRAKRLWIGEMGPHLLLKQVKDRVWEMKAMISRGEDPGAWKQQQAAMLTFGEFVEQQYLPYANKTVRRPDIIVSRLNTGALPWFRNKLLDTITTRDVQQFHATMKEKLSAITANHHLIALKRVLNVALQWEVITGKNPAVGVKKFQEPTGRDRYLSTDEVQRFLVALDECDNVPVASGLRMLLYTGLRSAEVFSLPWSEVDFEAKSIHLRKTKAGKARRVYLSSQAWAEIERMKERHDGTHKFVFPGYHPGDHVREPHRCFRNILKAAKIDDFRIHDIRHTHASYLVQSGASLFEVQKALGHSSSQMTQRYAHLNDTTLRDRAEVASQRLTRTDTMDVKDEEAAA
jgi:integrase